MESRELVRLIAVSVGVFIVGDGIASAQELCLPQASGVPFTTRRAPDWWTDAGVPSTEPWRASPLLDPRWRGASQISYATGTSQQVRLRGLFDPTQDGATHLYLSWHHAVPMEGDLVSLYVGFSHDGTAANARIFKITLEADPSTNTQPVRERVAPVCDHADTTGSAPHCDATQLTHYRLYTLNGSGDGFEFNDEATEGTADARWIHDFGRVWASDPDSDGDGNEYTIELRVPVGAGGVANGIEIVGQQTRFWYQLASCSNTDPSLCEFEGRWPRTIALAEEPSITGILAPPGTTIDDWMADWSTLTLGTGTCASGVSIDSIDIGVLDDPASDPLTGPLTHRIRGQQGCADFENRFVARITNRSGTALAPGDVTATFRIADWGSTPIVVPRPADWTHIPGGQDVSAGAIPAMAGSTPGRGVASTSWTLSAAERCEYGVGAVSDAECATDDGCGSPTRDDHQCILVELEGTAAINFDRDSVYRNMDFVTSSVFERDATVSIRGLPALTGAPQREVYLYVKTRNLPDRYDRPTDPMKLTVAAASARLDEIGKIWKRMPPDIAEEAAHLDAVVRAGKGGTTAEALQRLPTTLLREIMPMVEIHVFHDSGRTIDVAGVQRKILTAQTSFGYFVMHNGEAEGWKTRLQGLDGATLEQLDDYLYRVAIDHDSTVKIRTRIESIERQDRPPPRCTSWQCWWEKWWWLFALILGFAILIVVVVIARRKS